LHIVLPGALLAILFLLVSRIVLGWHKRQLAYQADELAVRWMGRSAICHGLHLLEDEHLHTSSTRWGEPDLHERIRRVCGTAVKVRPERLTLVR
jgi:Zn-dependent protease with chaperone function